MKLIVGLGNIGEEYKNTRHNMGFMCIDHFAEKNGFQFKDEPKFKGMIANINYQGQKAILLKPSTYMNLSGESVEKVLQFYKIDVNDMLVISDDLDSPFGRVRIRPKGASGGHNGLKNIALHVGTEEFKRVKVGIERSKVIPVIDWVLMKYKPEEIKALDESFEKVSNAISDFILDVDFVKIASRYSASK